MKEQKDSDLAQSDLAQEDGLDRRGFLKCMA